MKLFGIMVAVCVSLLSAIGAEASTNASPATVRVFQTDVQIFVPNVRRLVASNEWKYEYVEVRGCFPSSGPSRMALRESPTYSEVLCSHCEKKGIKLLPPGTLFYNDRTGELLARGAREDLEKLARLVLALNSPHHP